MTLGSVDNNPHLLIWSLVLHQRKHLCSGERCLWRVPAGEQVLLSLPLTDPRSWEATFQTHGCGKR